MASVPDPREPASYESSGSTCLNDECSPPTLTSPRFLADSAAPVFPLNGDDLTDTASGFAHDGPCTSDSTSSFNSTPLDERHVFLCFKEPQTWPALVEAADFDRLPRFLAATMKVRKNVMSKKTRLTICEGKDGTDFSNGDVMIFPDMIRYKGLTHFDVDTFVDEVLVQNQEWLSGRPEKLFGSHIFVCAHASHDVRCGVSGPIIIGRLRTEISARGLDKCVFVRPCTHVGNHKYKGNIIVFRVDATGVASGRCYVFATSDDVCNFLDRLFGTSGLAHSNDRSIGTIAIDSLQAHSNSVQHIDNGYFRNDTWEGQELLNGHIAEKGSLRSSLQGRNGSNRGLPNHRWWHASWWVETWDRDDTLAALAVVAAASSVAVACHLYRSHSRH